MMRFGLVAAFVASLAVSAAGQDAVEIKVADPKAGERVKVTVEEKAETKFVVKAKEMEQAKNEVKTKLFVYVDEVIEADAAAKKPTKVKRTYEKATTGTDGKTSTLPVEGKTVMIEKKGDKYTFTIDGKGVEGDALLLLDNEFNKKNKDDNRDLMLPKKAVKPGETWKIDTDALVKSIGSNDLKLDAAKTTANGKLVKAYKEGGRQFGVIELTVNAAITDLGPKLPIKVKEGSMVITITGDGVIDGSSPQGKSTTVAKVKVAGGAEGIDVSIDSASTETRTMEMLPKGKR